jgi:hypothetical protein
MTYDGSSNAVRRDARLILVAFDDFKCPNAASTSRTLSQC